QPFATISFLSGISLVCSTKPLPPPRSCRPAAYSIQPGRRGSRPPQLLDVGISAGASRRRRGWGRAPSRSHDGAAVLERAGCGDAVRCRHHGSHTRRRDTNSEGSPGPKPPGQPVSTGGVGERQGDEYNAGKVRPKPSHRERNRKISSATGTLPSNRRYSTTHELLTTAFSTSSATSGQSSFLFFLWLAAGGSRR
ncbi:unnamed protein product, partial [Urochloa humidicola]